MPIVPLPVPVFSTTVRVAPVPFTLAIEAPTRPVVCKVKSPASTPVTGSEKVTAYSTVAAPVVAGPVRVMLVTVGGKRTTVYDGPLKFPLLFPLPPSGCDWLEVVMTSRIVSLSTSLSPTDPVPVIPFTVTVYEEPLPAIVTPVVATDPVRAT